MYACQYEWRQLFDALLTYEGADAWADVLAPWSVSPAGEGERRWLAEYGRRAPDSAAAAEDEDVCRLYAASRVASVLLLTLQGGGGPRVTADAYAAFFESLGFEVVPPRPFHPFYHEITVVEQNSPDDEPIAVVRELWPALMLGDLLFMRAGCGVRGGTERLDAATATGGALYWAYTRADRPCEDRSHGWGSNSQWRTSHRRDYRTPVGYLYNADGDESLDGRSGVVEGVDAAVWAEVVRFRCLLRPRPEVDTRPGALYPWEYRLTEPATSPAP